METSLLDLNVKPSNIVSKINAQHGSQSMHLEDLDAHCAESPHPNTIVLSSELLILDDDPHSNADSLDFSYMSAFLPTIPSKSTPTYTHHHHPNEAKSNTPQPLPPVTMFGNKLSNICSSDPDSLSTMSSSSLSTKAFNPNRTVNTQSDIVNETILKSSSNSNPSFNNNSNNNKVNSSSSSSSVEPVSLVCAICNDNASGKHYGVISCEGCKGFFKRSVRRQLTYVCRESGQCLVDRRKRTRCQHCRFEQCLAKGMRREAVQEERHRPIPVETNPLSSTTVQQSPNIPHVITTTSVNKNNNNNSNNNNGGGGGSDCSSNDNTSMLKSGSKCAPLATNHVTSCSSSFSATSDRHNPTNLKFPEVNCYSNCTASRQSISANLPQANPSDQIPFLNLSTLLNAELSTDRKLTLSDKGESIYEDIPENDPSGIHPLIIICQSVEQQLPELVNWARQLPAFSKGCLSTADQFSLIKSAWPELLLITAAYHSAAVKDGILLSNGRHLSRKVAKSNGLGPLVDRILSELVARFRDLGLQRTELALLKAVLLFNPDANGLSSRTTIESVREHLYTALHSYCVTNQPQDNSRFTKLLLRLPPLRSIACKCLEHLVFVKLAAEDPTSRRLINLVEHGIWPMS